MDSQYCYYFYELLIRLLTGGAYFAAYEMQEGVFKALFAVEAVLEALVEAPTLKVGGYAFYMLTNKSVEDIKIVQDQSNRSALGKVGSFFLAFGGTCLLAYVIGRLEELMLGRVGDPDGIEEDDNPWEVVENLVALPSLQLCVICQERPRNVVFLNCRHFSVCEVCSEELRNGRCPICRQSVVGCLTVFVS